MIKHSTYEPERIKAKRNKKTSDRKWIFGISGGIFTIAFLLIFFLYLKPNHAYENAMGLMEQHEFDSAKEILDGIPKFKDSQALSVKCTYLKGIDFYDAGAYASAEEIFLQLTDYEDSANYLVLSKYGLAEAAYEEQEYDQVYSLLDEISSYEKSEALRRKTDYAVAVDTFQANQYEEALVQFEGMLEYEDATEYAGQCLIAMAEAFPEDDYTNRLATLYRGIEMGCDITETWDSQCQVVYDLAMEYYDQKKYGSSKETFELIAPYEFKDSVGKVMKCEMIIDTKESAYHGTWVNYSTGVVITFEEGAISYHTKSDPTETAVKEVNYDPNENIYYFTTIGVYHTKLTGNTLSIKSDDGKGTMLSGSFQKYLDEEHTTTLSNIKQMVVIPMDN